MLMRKLVVVLAAVVASAAAGQTSFTYQGHLERDGAPVSGPVDLEFTLWNAAGGGAQVGGPISLPATPVADGLVTVELDFGASAFDGQARWLQVRVNGGLLLPRQAVTGSPYSIQTRGIYVAPDGDVGIGTTGPIAQLDVFSEKTGEAALKAASTRNDGIAAFTEADTFSGVYAATGNTNAYAVFARNSGSGAEAYLAHRGNGVYGKGPGFAGFFEGAGYFSGSLRVGRTTALSGAEVFGVHAQAGPGSYGGMYVSTASSSGLPFYGYGTGTTGRMWTYLDGASGDWRVYNSGNQLTVESSGEVGIRTIDPVFTLHVNGTAGKPGGGSWAVASDERLKTNVQPLEGSLQTLLQLRGIQFEFRDAEAIAEREGPQIGMIAQEVELVMPDWVDERSDGYKTVTYRGFEALTVEALRELHTEVLARHAEVAALRAQNAALAERLARLEAMVQPGG
jgi:hypothetical protein